MRFFFFSFFPSSRRPLPCSAPPPLLPLRSAAPPSPLGCRLLPLLRSPAATSALLSFPCSCRGRPPTPPRCASDAEPRPNITKQQQLPFASISEAKLAGDLEELHEVPKWKLLEALNAVPYLELL